MTFDHQLRRYFGTTDIAALPAQTLAAGLEHMRVDLGLERDRGRRFALWAMMYVLGSAPELDATFPDERERDAARNFIDLTDKADVPE